MALARLPEPEHIGGRYAVEGVLARTPSSRVLRCRRSDGRGVVVKELRILDLPDWSPVDRLAREAEVLGALRHPAIPALVETLEVDTDRGHVFSLVMERFEGDTLEARIRHGPLLGDGDLVGVADRLLKVLEYLHGRRPPVFHNDIDPSHVILRPDGSIGLVGFGSACVGWHLSTDRDVSGADGMGPATMALATPATDLRKLGATLATAITGASSVDVAHPLALPPELPIRPVLRELVERLQGSARSVDASTAAEFRRFLGPSLHAMPPAPAVATQRGRLDWPQRVALGPAPRDPEGPFADVFRNLVDPGNPLRNIRSTVGRAGAQALYALLGITTFGVLPLTHVLTRRARTRTYAPLFEHGHATQGWIVAVEHRDPRSIWAAFEYAYRAEGRIRRGCIDYPVGLRRCFRAGDAITVLYDRWRPDKSCFVYRMPIDVL